MDFIIDLLNFLKFKKKEKKFRFIFFCENPYTYEFLKSYIYKKQNRKKCAILTFFKLEDKLIEKQNIIFLKTKIFKQIFFQTNKIPFFISSTPDLDNSIFLRSKFKNTKYIYIQHSPASLTMIYKEKAFNNFDAIQTINKSQYNEIYKINNFFKKKIKPFKSKYLINKNKLILKKPKTILVAPTWGTNFFEEDIFSQILMSIKKTNLDFVLRPHPETIRKNPNYFNNLETKKIIISRESKINLEDFSNLITDWSGIYFEFALITKIKPILINANRKMNNKNFMRFKDLPLEIRARKIIAHEIELNNLNLITDKLLIKNKMQEKKIIEEFLENEFY